MNILPQKGKKVSSEFTNSLYNHQNGTHSVCRTYNIHKQKAKSVYAFLKKHKASRFVDFIFYAVHYENKVVIQITVGGGCHNTDASFIKDLLCNGYDEFFVSPLFSVNEFQLPTGDIVKLKAKINAPLVEKKSIDFMPALNINMCCHG